MDRKPNVNYTRRLADRAEAFLASLVARPALNMLYA